MMQVEIGDNGFVVAAELLAEAFGLAPADVQPRMKSGALTSRCEQGMDEDAGRWRLTFYHEDRVLRLTVDDAGTILGRSTFANIGRGQTSST